jgi:hypothetical protein
VKIVNLAHDTILPMDFIPAIEYNAKAMEDSKKLQEA